MPERGGVGSAQPCWPPRPAVIGSSARFQTTPTVSALTYWPLIRTMLGDNQRLDTPEVLEFLMPFLNY
jgi:hypothetical protein